MSIARRLQLLYAIVVVNGDPDICTVKGHTDWYGAVEDERPKDGSIADSHFGDTERVAICNPDVVAIDLPGVVPLSTEVTMPEPWA